MKSIHEYMIDIEGPKGKCYEPSVKVTSLDVHSAYRDIMDRLKAVKQKYKARKDSYTIRVMYSEKIIYLEPVVEIKV